MTRTPPSDDSQQPEQTSTSRANEPLIRVRPDAHLAPGANERCPVCGQPYAQGGVPADTSQEETEVLLADTPTQEPSSKQEVIRCARCGTYSIGVLRASALPPE